MPMNAYGRWTVALALIIAALAPAAGHAAAARVEFVAGNVSAVGPNAGPRPLSKGSQIEVGDTVRTQSAGAQLRFADGTYVSLQPHTALKIDRFRFSENGKGSDHIALSLLQGGMRAAAGAIGRSDRRNHTVRTNLAILAVQGAEYSVRHESALEVFCASGSVSVQSDGGTLLLGSGQGGLVQNPKQEPQRSAQRPFLPPMSATSEAQASISNPMNPAQESLGSSAPVFMTGTFIGSRAVTTNAVFNARGIDESLSLDANGALTSFNASATTVGTATATSLGNDGAIAWGRWTAGVTGGSSAFSNIDVAQDPLHYVVGLPVSSMPTTGVATYTMLGATPPSSTGIVSGATLLDSRIRVDFLNVTASYDLSMSLTWAGGNTIVRTPDGGAPISLEPTSGRLTTFVVTPLLQQGAPLVTANLRDAIGFLSGPAATRAGMVYTVGVESGAGTGSIVGAVAYTR